MVVFFLFLLNGVLEDCLVRLTLSGMRLREDGVLLSAESTVCSLELSRLVGVRALNGSLLFLLLVRTLRLVCHVANLTLYRGFQQRWN